MNIEDILRENNELLHKVEINKYINCETGALEINLSDFKIFNDNKEKNDKFYLYGVVYNKKLNKYIETNGNFRFEFNIEDNNLYNNILKISSTKLIYKTIYEFAKLYNYTDFEIHFLLIPLHYKFLNVITESEKSFDRYLVKETINISKTQFFSLSLLKGSFNSLKILYYLAPFIVLILLQATVSYYIVTSGGFSWEIINYNNIINIITIFFTYMFSNTYSHITLLFGIFIVLMAFIVIIFMGSQISSALFILNFLKKKCRIIWHKTIVSCDKDKKTYLIEDININVYKNNFNNIFKSIYYAFCLILILPILITSTIVMYILLRDIIDINKKNINQVQTKSNIIYLISKEYIYNISFPLLVKTKDNKINVLMFSNEYEGYIYTMDEIKILIKRLKDNCNFENNFDKYFFENISNQRDFKFFYLTFLFGNIDNIQVSKIRNNEYDYILKNSTEYLKIMESLEKEIF